MFLDGYGADQMGDLPIPNSSVRRSARYAAKAKFKT